FEKVHRCILGPLFRLFRGEINEEMTEAIVDEIGHYPEETLTEGMKIVRRTCKSYPKIAHIVEACEQAEKGRRKPSECGPVKSTIPQEYLSEAEIVMLKPFGQMALREGWGGSLWARTKETGRTDWNENDAVRFRINQENAVQAAMQCDMARQPIDTDTRKERGITM